jgi:flagellum-specific ATP synthase
MIDEKEPTLQKYTEHLQDFDPVRAIGRIRRAHGLLLESHGPPMFVGELARVYPIKGQPFLVEATAVNGYYNNLMPYEETLTVEAGDKVSSLGNTLMVPVGMQLLGRVIDALGRPIDDKGPITPDALRSIFQPPPNAMQRPPIVDQIKTGVRAIDSLLSVGKGQRVGIFAGSGVGKSTLMGMMARNSSADINVIALIGERGREVREFLENELGEEGLKRSVVIVSTSDQTPLSRVRGAYVACTIAEYFRDMEKDVLFLFDSVTRLAMSQREIGLSNGEPPASRGYTPSVFSQLPKILERSGNASKGSITGIYTVLVEGDDMEEPISDAVRGILDGHIILSRQMAEKGHFPAIDILKSISRLSLKLQSKEHRAYSSHIRALLSAYRNAEDLISVGAYVKGSDPMVDESLLKLDEINRFLQQNIDEPIQLDHIFAHLRQLAEG